MSLTAGTLPAQFYNLFYFYIDKYNKMLFNISYMEEIEMKKIFTCFFALFVLNNVYSSGLRDYDMPKEVTDSLQTVAGYTEGNKLFIDVISEMQVANDRNFDMEHIINTYVSDVGPENKTNYDWITYLTGDITAVKMKMTVFMGLLEMYVNKQKEIILFHKKTFYKGIIILLDEYKNKGYNIKEREIEDLYIAGDRISFWGKEYTITTDNYTIILSYDNMNSKYASDPFKKIIIDKKSGTTYFDHYIGSSKEAILSLPVDHDYSDNPDTLKFFYDDKYVFFYFENDIVKRIEYGDTW
jgi:hypothetical protein